VQKRLLHILSDRRREVKVWKERERGREGERERGREGERERGREGERERGREKAVPGKGVTK
jgi:hypothetical protein